MICKIYSICDLFLYIQYLSGDCLTLAWIGLHLWPMFKFFLQCSKPSIQ